VFSEVLLGVDMSGTGEVACAVYVPVFSEVLLGVEMSSTCEVVCAV